MYQGHLGPPYVKVEELGDGPGRFNTPTDTVSSGSTSASGSVQVKVESNTPEFCFEDWLHRLEQDSLLLLEVLQLPQKSIVLPELNVGAARSAVASDVNLAPTASGEYILNENGFYTYIGAPGSSRATPSDAGFGTNKVVNVKGASKVRQEYKRPSFDEFCESRFPWLEEEDTAAPFGGNVYMWKSGEDLPLYVNDEPWNIAVDKSKLNPFRVSRLVQRTTRYERHYLDAIYAYVDAEPDAVDWSIVDLGQTESLGQVKRRRHSYKALPWEPMLIFSVFTNCKPMNFKGSFAVAPHRIRQLCFGKVNMRKRRAWTRVARLRPRQ